MSRSALFVIAIVAFRRTNASPIFPIVWPESRTIDVDNNVVVAKPTLPPTYILPEIPDLNFTTKFNDLSNYDSVALVGNMALLLGSVLAWGQFPKSILEFVEGDEGAFTGREGGSYLPLLRDSTPLHAIAKPIGTFVRGIGKLIGKESGNNRRQGSFNYKGPKRLFSETTNYLPSQGFRHGNRPSQHIESYNEEYLFDHSYPAAKRPKQGRRRRYKKLQDTFRNTDQITSSNDLSYDIVNEVLTPVSENSVGASLGSKPGRLPRRRKLNAKRRRNQRRNRLKGLKNKKNGRSLVRVVKKIRKGKKNGKSTNKEEITTESPNHAVAHGKEVENFGENFNDFYGSNSASTPFWSQGNYFDVQDNIIQDSNLQSEVLPPMQSTLSSDNEFNGFMPSTSKNDNNFDGFFENDPFKDIGQGFDFGWDSWDSKKLK